MQMFYVNRACLRLLSTILPIVFIGFCASCGRREEPLHVDATTFKGGRRVVIKRGSEVIFEELRVPDYVSFTFRSNGRNVLVAVDSDTDGRFDEIWVPSEKRGDVGEVYTRNENDTLRPDEARRREYMSFSQSGCERAKQNINKLKQEASAAVQEAIAGQNDECCELEGE